MKKLLYVLLLAAGFSACTDSTDNTNLQNAAEVPPAPATEKTSHAETFTEYFALLNRYDSSFSAERFGEEERATMQTSEAYPIEEARLQPYKPLLIYNADSTLAIDLFSYNYLLSRRGGTTYAQAGEPDTEVALIDFKENKRRRLLYVGPSFSILDAKWLDTEEVAIAGAEVISDQQIKPIIWKISLPEDKMETEFYTDTITANVEAIRQARFSQVQFK